MTYDYEAAADALADEAAEERFKRTRHNRLMQLPFGHPDEQDYEDDEEGED